MNIEQLFPWCTLPREGCEEIEPGKFGSLHKHILPEQQEFLSDTSRYLAMLGGYGSGKTVVAAVLGVALSLAIPGNIGIAMRRSYPKLHDSTERIFLETLQRADVEFKAYEVRDGWPHRIVLPNASEISFRETKDVGRFLGPEYGWFYGDEFIEEPEKTFRELTGRLRLKRADPYRRGFITTNPPNSPAYNPHWIQNLWGLDPGRRVVEIEGERVTFRLWRVSTRRNPFLPKDYVAGLLLTHSPSEARRIIEGEYGHSFKGKPVYSPPFEFKDHVGLPRVHPISLARSWDFGYRQPAVTWHQFVQCVKKSLHWHILHEYVPANRTSEVLAQEVLDITAKRFPEIPRMMTIDGGDTAGAQYNEHGPGPIIRLSWSKAEGGFGLRFRHEKFPKIDPGLDYVRKLLRETCACGQPMVLIHRQCTAVIDGFAGGYHYRDLPPDKSVPKTALEPEKDGYYDNVMDTIRYAALLFHRPANRSPDFWRLLTQDQGTSYNERNLPNVEPWVGEDLSMAWLRW